MVMNKAKKFWERVIKTDSCWLWRGEKNSMGYGRLAFGSQKYGKRKRIFAHRLSLELHGVQVLESDTVMHTCDTPLCVNPEHLKVTTIAGNLEDMRSKKRHNFGQKNGGAKLSNETVLKLVDMVATGSDVNSAAKILGIRPENAKTILRGNRWSIVTGIEGKH